MTHKQLIVEQPISRQTRINEIVENYWYWMRSEPSKWRFIEWLIWKHKEPCSFGMFIECLDNYEGELK